MDVRIEPSWKQQLQEEFDKPYFEKLVTFYGAQNETYIEGWEEKI